MYARQNVRRIIRQAMPLPCCDRAVVRHRPRIGRRLVRGYVGCIAVADDRSADDALRTDRRDRRARAIAGEQAKAGCIDLRR